MARKLSHTLAKVTEKLELNGSKLVTSKQLLEICRQNGINYPVEQISFRLVKEGWFLPTGISGVWEYIPAAVAGTYSSNDPLLSLKAFQLKYPNIKFALTLQTAAWAQGYSDRIPSKLHICSANPINKRLPHNIKVYKYKWSNETKTVKKNIQSLTPESIIVHIVSKPTAISNWESALVWIEELAYEIEYEKLYIELKNHNKSTKVRCGYLLSGLRPDIANLLYKEINPKSKIRFGPKQKSIRNNEKWMISDTVLPFNPEELNEAK